MKCLQYVRVEVVVSMRVRMGALARCARGARQLRQARQRAGRPPFGSGGRPARSKEARLAGHPDSQIVLALRVNLFNVLESRLIIKNLINYKL